MNPDIKKQWVEALRSGRFIQTDGMLRDMESKFCCLGVLCDIVDPNGWNYNSGEGFKHCGLSGLPSQDILTSVGLDDDVARTLSEMNDGIDQSRDTRHTFVEIADYIEANL